MTISNAELAAMKAQAECALKEKRRTLFMPEVQLRIISEVEELRSALRGIATFDPDNNNANDLFRIIAKARTALGEEPWL